MSETKNDNLGLNLKATDTPKITETPIIPETGIFGRKNTLSVASRSSSCLFWKTKVHISAETACFGRNTEYSYW